MTPLLALALPDAPHFLCHCCLALLFFLQAARRLANRLLAMAMAAWHARCLVMKRVRKLMALMLGKRTRDLHTRWVLP